jgi:putative endopeptidase
MKPSLALTLAAFPLHFTSAADNISTDAPRFATLSFDLSGRDESVEPADDFFAYASGTYLKNTEIPADRSRYGNFDALAILSETRVRKILVEAAARHEASTAKIGAWFVAFMDEARVEAAGASPIAPQLAEIKFAATREDLATIMGKPGGLCRGLFGTGISPDAKNPTRYAVRIGSSGLGLPDKDYYLKPSFAEIKAEYQKYISTMLNLAGWPDAEKYLGEILAFETKLAEASWDRTMLRNRDKTYHAMTPDEIATLAPGFGFRELLESGGLGQVKRIIVADDSAFPRKAAIFAATPLDVLKAWMAFGTADASAPYLSKAFVEASFDFRAKTLSGQPEQLARWKRAVASTNGALGEDIGKVYVTRYFPEASKKQMIELVSNIQSALATRIDQLEWMGAATKKAAQEKLALFSVKIGYPDKFRDYSGLVVKRDDLYGNVERAYVFGWKYQLDRLNEPVDRSEWGIPPQTVNAYYNSSLNEIVFPAAILQPPFFDPQADPAINYGGIAAVIGHEISHGFDDQGRKSDGNGVLKDWWTEEDAKNFNDRAARLAAQYEKFEILPGEHVNGKLTRGENIGDMGGVNLALAAYHTSLGGKPAPVIDGITGDQRVFFSWAQVWRTKIRDEALLKQIHSDPHAPAEARVNGVVRNIDAWYDAFGVKPGDKLYLKPEDRVKIW